MIDFIADEEAGRRGQAHRQARRQGRHDVDAGSTLASRRSGGRRQGRRTAAAAARRRRRRRQAARSSPGFIPAIAGFDDAGEGRERAQGRAGREGRREGRRWTSSRSTARTVGNWREFRTELRVGAEGREPAQGRRQGEGHRSRTGRARKLDVELALEMIELAGRRRRRRPAEPTRGRSCIDRTVGGQQAERAGRPGQGRLPDRRRLHVARTTARPGPASTA